MNSFKLGNLAGLELTAKPSALIGSLILWALLGGIALAVLKFSPGEAILGGLLAMLLHWVSETVHNLGHSVAARQTGYPMIGVRYIWVLAASVYPRDEPALPGRIHIRRALGGPLGSAVFTLVLGVVVLALRAVEGSFIWWLLVFAFLDNLLVFTLGAFVPLGFTDGSTLLRWWGKP
jgi:hypothetical protein